MFRKSGSKGRDPQINLASAAGAAESSPAKPAPERHPQSVESSPVQRKADFHIGGRDCGSMVSELGLKQYISALRTNKRITAIVILLDF